MPQQKTHRCAMITTVCRLFTKSSFRATRTKYSLVASNALVASSSISMHGFQSKKLFSKSLLQVGVTKTTIMTSKLEMQTRITNNLFSTVIQLLTIKNITDLQKTINTTNSDKSSRDCDTLLLTSTQTGRSLLTNYCFETFWHFCDEVHSIRLCCSLMHLQYLY